jgi:large subunit ribosomal protein L5
MELSRESLLLETGKRVSVANSGSTIEKNRTRMENIYLNEVRGSLEKEFDYPNPMQVPNLEKISVNVGLGESLTNKNAIEAMVDDITMIIGQKPVVTRAKISIANFNLREGMRVGVKATLRSDRMWDFFDRLVNLSLPRIRDFRGVDINSFDGQGNYNLGIVEHIIFPEIDYGKVDRIRGFQVTMVTSVNSDQEALRLLQLLGMPFTGGKNG